MINRVQRKIQHILSFDPKRVYYRDRVRPQILNTPPIEVETASSAELHVLTSEKDWVNLVWSLKSFYQYVDERYALAIHGDDSLTEEHASILRSQFPGARVIRQDDIRSEVIDSLAAYPNCKRLRETNTLSIKVFDFLHCLNADKMILFDSDLLFFSKPEAFLDALNRTDKRVNAFNRDVGTAYAISVEDINNAGIEVHPEVNSGFGVVHKDSMPLEWIEEFLSIPGLADGHFWRIEQSLYALCASRFGVELLPNEYQVFVEGRLEDQPFRHYVGAVRDQMYVEGMKKLKPTLIV